MRHAIKLLIVMMAFTLFAACLFKQKLRDVKPQGWWAQRGTVVPHDSFPADCSLCHEGDDWQSIRSEFEFDHLAESGVKLVGAHKAAECLRCHNDRGPVAAFAQRGCAGCHEDVHRGQLGADCKLCHDEVDWQPSEQIALHNRTRFPLVGAHAAVACWRCHEGARIGNYSMIDTQCITCHSDDLATATNPDHMVLGWVDDCDRCHTATSWSSAGFNHTIFPLTGAHRSLDCQRCHANNIFTGLDRACASCHLDDYNGTSDPNHAAGGFSLSCEQCHGTSSWEGGRFRHIGITTGCIDCHLDDFNGASDPEHAAAGFPMSCEQCHGTNSWSGASFNHTGITTACVDCHQDDFNATTDPNHMVAGFPTSCESCHNTNMWSGATFVHLPMVITNGPHNRACTDCHLNPSSFLAFSCTHCHDHRQSKMAKEHDGEDGYVWESNACYSCHPNGFE